MGTSKRVSIEPSAPQPRAHTAWAIVLLPYAIPLMFLYLFPSWVQLAALLVSIGVLMYVLRSHLPHWAWPFHPRHREPLLDVEPETRAPTGPLHPPDPLLDPYDAASGVGRFAVGERAASVDVRYAVSPAVGHAKLRRATERAARASKGALGASERVRVTADVRDASAGNVVRIRFVVRGPAVSREQVERVGARFHDALKDALAGHEVRALG